jgi:hypothetical protein
MLGIDAAAFVEYAAPMKAKGCLVEMCLVCALAALALPAAAAAIPGYEVHPASTELFFEPEAKGAYEFVVEANDQQRVLLAVETGLFTATEYSTQGHVSSKRIEAAFGDLGHIDIKIRLAPGKAQHYPPRKGCRGRGSTYIPGTFRGAVEYSGEGDVPAVSMPHGEIDFIRHFKRVCKSPLLAAGQGKKKGKKRKPKIEVGDLAVSGQGEGRTVILEALNFASKQHPARSFGLLFAADYERREKVRIERSTLGFFGPESFRVSKRGNKPETVRVEPPEPFAGSALYSHSPGSPPTWTGDLRIDLPGAVNIPLAGPSLKAAFCRGSSLARAERCLQGSGSHSQPLALARLSSLR